MIFPTTHTIQQPLALAHMYGQTFVMIHMKIIESIQIMILFNTPHDKNLRVLNK